MDRVQQEMQLQMIESMMKHCKEKTLKRTHTSKDLAGGEQQAFQNCLMKYNELPMIVMEEMN